MTLRNSGQRPALIPLNRGTIPQRESALKEQGCDRSKLSVNRWPRVKTQVPVRNKQRNSVVPGGQT